MIGTSEVRECGAFHRASYNVPPNVLTLSCKDRPPCRPPSGGGAAAATNMQWRERSAADVTPAAQFGAAEPRLGGFCQLVRAVRRSFGKWLPWTRQICYFETC